MAGWVTGGLDPSSWPQLGSWPSCCHHTKPLSLAPLLLGCNCLGGLVNPVKKTNSSSTLPAGHRGWILSSRLVARGTRPEVDWPGGDPAPRGCLSKAGPELLHPEWLWSHGQIRTTPSLQGLYLYKGRVVWIN